MVKKAVIPIAGYGTRMLPATIAIPKTMLNVVDKPVLEYLIEEIVDAGIKEILLITNLGTNIIEEHFSRRYELEEFLKQDGKTEMLENLKNKFKGINIYVKRASTNESLAHSIYDAKYFVGNEPFLLVLGDEIFEDGISCSKNLVKKYNELKTPIIAVKRVGKHLIKNYGIVEGKNYKDNLIIIDNMLEKPESHETDSNLAIIGRYVLTPSIFDKIKYQITKCNSSDFTEAILHMQEIKFALEIDGQRFDCGNKLGLIEANINFGLNNPETREGLKKYLQKIYKEI